MFARDHALLELDAKRLPGWPSGLLRPRNPRAGGEGQRPRLPDPRDRALAEQIVAGVVKNLLYLQHLIGHYAQRSLRSVDPLAQKILAIGLYQLRFLDRIPPAAAVHEAVEQSRRFGRGRAAGFINAVLRKAATQPPPDPPDPQTDAAGYAELILSHPRELFRRMADLYGTAAALSLCEHNNAEPPMIVRLFAGRSAADLGGPGVSVTPHEQPGMLIVRCARPALLAEWSRQGIAQVQDPTAASIVPHLRIEPGQRVLDRCCGLGTKTFQIIEQAGTSGWVLATDPSQSRARTLQRLAAERHIDNIEIRGVGMLSDLPPETTAEFDRILVDAPCSNSGVLARRPEARYAQTRQGVGSVGRLQGRILEDTAPHLKTGGLLLYSTCSIWPEENQQRVAEFLARHAEYHLIEEQDVPPSTDSDPTRYRDGGYFAVMQRKDAGTPGAPADTGSELNG